MTLPQIYLYVNAALYAIFALWCTIMPTITANYLGLAFHPDKPGSGKSEYITVYGGMEMAFALFFLIAAIKPELRAAGMLFAVLFYGCLVAWRVPTLLFVPGVKATTYGFAGGELVLGAIGVWLWLSQRPGA